MSFWDDAKSVLSTVAPTLASAVGGPLAGVATTAIISALGLAPDTRPEQVASIVTGASVDQLAQLKKADEEFAEKMGQLEIDASKLAVDDRSNARAREVALKDHAPMGLAALITFGFFGLLGMMAFHDVPAGNQQILNIMLGSLGAGFTMVLGYYFGASVTPNTAPAGK